MTGEKDAIARAIYERRNGHGCKPWSLLPKAHKEPYLGDAEAAQALFAPILAEKERDNRQLRLEVAEEKETSRISIYGWRDKANEMEARALAAEAALAGEKGVNALTEGTLLRGLVAELARGQRSYPAAYQRGHTLVSLGLAEYADETVENKSYWLRLTEIGHAFAAAIRAQGE